MNAIVETARFQLRDGVTPAHFLALAERFTTEVGPLVPGLERRELLQTADGGFLLIARFDSREHFDGAKAAIGSHPAATAFSDGIDFATFTLECHDVVQSAHLTQHRRVDYGSQRTLGAGEGTAYDWSKDHVVIKTPLELTEGRVTLVEDTLKPGFHLPRHHHRRMVEVFYVIDGEVVFAFDDETVIATTGMTINIPPGTWHEVTSEAGAKLLTIFTPGGFDHYFAELARSSETELDDDATVTALGEEYDSWSR